MVEKRKTQTRNVLRGIVVSDKNDKTISVEITTHRKHRLYGKKTKWTTKFQAHDEKNEASVGDKVLIMTTRPLSKNKYFRLVKILEKAKKIN